MSSDVEGARRSLVYAVVGILLAACVGADEAIEVDNPARLGGVVAAKWVEESAVPAAGEIPDTPPALGPSSGPQIIHTEPDAVYLVVWGNNCRPEVTVGGMAPQNEFQVLVDLIWDETDTCRGAINEWFIQARVGDDVDTSVAEVAMNLDRHGGDN